MSWNASEILARAFQPYKNRCLSILERQAKNRKEEGPLLNGKPIKEDKK